MKYKIKLVNGKYQSYVKEGLFYTTLYAILEDGSIDKTPRRYNTEEKAWKSCEEYFIRIKKEKEFRKKIKPRML